MSKKRKKLIVDISDAYRFKLKKIFDSEIKNAERLVKKDLFPILTGVVQREDSISSFSDLFKRVLRGIYINHFGALLAGGIPDTNLYQRKIIKKVDKVFIGAGNDHKREFDKSLNSIANVEPLKSDPFVKEYLELFIKSNTKKITTISESYFSEVEDIVMNGLQSGTSNKSIVKELKEKIIDRGEFHKSRAKLVATDQIQKLNGQLDKVRQKSNGGSRYIWRTRGNSAVRDDHAKLKGAIFEWGKPPITVTTGKRSGERNEPGQDINCKCQAEMVIEDLLGERTAKIIKAEEKTQQLKSLGIL